MWIQTVRCSHFHRDRPIPYTRGLHVFGYSTVTEQRCGYASLITDNDLFFSFNLTTRSNSLNNKFYSQYQYFLYNTISNLFDKGMNHKQIADWLNTRDIKTPRGHKFSNAHSHSILKKKKLSDDKFQTVYPSEISNCSLEHFDKSVMNQ